MNESALATGEQIEFYNSALVNLCDLQDVSTKAVKTEEEAKREAEDSCTDGGGAQQVQTSIPFCSHAAA